MTAAGGALGVVSSPSHALARATGHVPARAEHISGPQGYLAW